MKTIGFIDYFLDEWHANNYPAWIENAVGKLGADIKLTYAWAEKDSENGLTTKKWCERFGVTECKSIEELCEKSDYLIILSPSNPEKHLEYARVALTYGKRTYIDKTFAPSFDEAKEIFSLADKNKAEIFSSSALRYASELSSLKNSTDINISGGGKSVDEYIVHQIEQLVVLYGIGAVSVSSGTQGDPRIFDVKYSDGKKASLKFSSGLPFEIFDGTTGVKQSITSDFFSGLISDIINFFETGRHDPTMEQTLEVMKIRDAVLKADQSFGSTVNIG